MLYSLPPAGTPIGLKEFTLIFSSLGQRLHNRNQFQSLLGELSGSRHCILVNSGRTAQYLIIRALASLDSRKRQHVVIPAYTCFSVPASIVKAGLKPLPVDILPETMDYDYARLNEIDFDNVLAITSTNLFGILSNWTCLKEIAGKHNLYLIDDAAQAMGSIYNGTPAGTLGDAGFYSLDRGKNLSTINGGVLLTNDDQLAEKVNSYLEPYQPSGLLQESSSAMKLLLYSLLLKPSLYWIPASLPCSGLGETIYDDKFAIGQLGSLQATVGNVLLPLLQELNESRRVRARKLSEKLVGSVSFRVPGYTETDCPAYIRLPVMASSRRVRDHAVKALKNTGISYTRMYPSTIPNIPGIAPKLATAATEFPGAQAVVEQLFTLPTHPYLTDSDIERITTCLINIR